MFYEQLEKGATSTHAGTEKQPVSRAKCRGLAKDFANTTRLTNQAPTMSIRKSPLGTIMQLNLLLTVVHLMPILEISACASMHHTGTEMAFWLARFLVDVCKYPFYGPLVRATCSCAALGMTILSSFDYYWESLYLFFS
jgi:hypothetical protein